MTVCSRCGKENQDHYKFCLGCGNDIHAAQAARAGSSDAAPAGDGASVVTAPTAREAPRENGAAPGRSVATSPIITAPASGAAAAARVGTPAHVPAVAGPAPMRACPTCGKPVPYEFVFCGSCGTRLGAAVPPAGAAAPAVAHTPAVLAPAPAAAPQARGKLVLIRPDGGEGGSMSLQDGETLIGRTAGTLFESDSYLSPKHAWFIFRGSGVLVRDAASLNGVFVKMSGEEEIADGEVFRLGQELLRFDIIRAAQPLEDGTEIMGSPNPGYWARLSVILGRGQDGSAFPLFGDSMVVGRERGDILFPEDGYVSGTHARVSRRDGRYFLADLNSSNGSFLRIRGERTLKSGAFLLLGQQLFRIQYT